MLVYIVDDDVEIIKMMEFRLKREQYEVESFKTGQAVLDRMKINTPDALVLDFHIPEKDGLEIMEELESLGQIDKFPIIVISGTIDICGKGFPEGVNIQLLSKPIEFKNFLYVLKKLLDASCN